MNIRKALQSVKLEVIYGLRLNRIYRQVVGDETNKVLKNTYLLLSATLGFSAFMAVLSMSMVINRWGVYMMSCRIYGAGHVRTLRLTLVLGWGSYSL